MAVFEERAVASRCWNDARCERVDESLPVANETILAAIRLLIEKAGILAEPSGAAGIAALMEIGARFQGAAVVCVITGSNLDPRLVSRLAG